MDLFGGNTMVALVKELDAGTVRQRVLANNIANVNTPYFKKSEVLFESLLKKALGKEPAKMLTTDPRHFGARPALADLRPEVILSNATTMRSDGNNVDVDEEMTNLAANDIMFQTAAGLLSDRYNGLRTVISGKSS